MGGDGTWNFAAGTIGDDEREGQNDPPVQAACAHGLRPPPGCRPDVGRPPRVALVEDIYCPSRVRLPRPVLAAGVRGAELHAPGVSPPRRDTLFHVTLLDLVSHSGEHSGTLGRFRFNRAGQGGALPAATHV